ncbi:type I restriction enzyme, S subunit [Enterobacter sp. NFR05]|nr:type I restriction enzyme, S subunit [Enterobacter sp. NFR05]
MSGGKLPEGWVNCELSALGHIVTGKTPSTKEPAYFGGEIPFIKPGDLEFNGYINKTTDTLTEKGLSFVPSLPANSIAVTCIGNLGKVGITTKRSASNQQINSLIPHDGLNNKFIYYQTLTLKQWLESQSSATTIAIVNKSKFSQAPIKLPALSEQKIIAEKLDTLLAQVDSTKARLEQIPQILKRFRQAVLAAAVSGRLTKVWREKNQDSSSSGEWQQFALSELGVLSRGKSKHRPRNDPRLFGDTYPFIQTGEVANSLGRIKAATKFYSEFGLSQSKLFPQGTLCITIAANIADTAILDIDACFPDSVVGFIPKKNKSHVLFIKYLIDANKEDLEAYAPATAQKNINLKVLNDLRFPMPDIEEQHEIVRRVEQLFAYADTIEKQVNNALTRANSLTQSILAKAFRGELTAQWRAENPDLISGENSAAALLEKIKAERAANCGKKTSRKKS